MDRRKTVGHLRDAIKGRIANALANVDANNLTLWKVHTSVHNVSRLELLESNQLQPTRKIDKYFPSSEILADETINIIVQSPVITLQNGWLIYLLLFI